MIKDQQTQVARLRQAFHDSYGIENMDKCYEPYQRVRLAMHPKDRGDWGVVLMRWDNAHHGEEKTTQLVRDAGI